MKAGADAGVFFRVGKAFYFQPEIVYSFRSSSFKGVVNEIGHIEKFKNHYFDVPLLLGYKFIDKEIVKFRLFIGPRLGFQMTNNAKIDPMGVMQIGGRAGVGIDIWRFALDAGYDFSVNQPNANISSSWWKQNMVNISLGFKIFKD